MWIFLFFQRQSLDLDDERAEPDDGRVVPPACARARRMRRVPHDQARADERARRAELCGHAGLREPGDGVRQVRAEVLLPRRRER